MAMDLSNRLIITQPMYFSEPSAKCGYCKGEKSEETNFYSLQSWYKSDKDDPKTQDDHVNSTIGFQCELLSVEIYDKLCNNGFRRSGKFIYKPDLLRSCCRLFTIRTTPDEVQLTKELKSCISKFRKFIEVEPLKHQTKNAKFNYLKEILNIEMNAKNKFYTRFEPATYTKEKYELFAKYQESIHNDFKHSERSFKRFLCDSPFSEEVILGNIEEWEQLNEWVTFEKDIDQPIKRIGPTHECYYYEDQLIAIAVTDFLPSGMSSVYFIWDPTFKKLSLGKLSALRELTVLSRINRPYYYLGYYIDDCHKMNYKASYGGELLDVANLKYISLPFLKEKHIIDEGKFFIMEENAISSSDSKPVRELAMNDSFSRIGIFPNMTENSINIAESIYGMGECNGGAYENIENVIEELKEYGVNYSIDKNKYKYRAMDEFDEEDSDEDSDEPEKLRRLPNVIPGVMPLWELLHMFKCGRIDEINGKLFIYDTEQHHIRPVYDFMGESSETRTMICNMIRILGLDQTKNVLAII